MIQTEYFIFIIACFAFSLKRLLRYLQYFQQEGYDSKRFLKWLWKHNAFDRRGALALILTAVVLSITSVGALFFGALLLFGWSFFEKNPLKQGKLKLVMTSRAKRIYMTALSLYVVCQMAISFFLSEYELLIAQMLIFQLLPCFIVAGVGMLSFDEKRRQSNYRKEAVDRLNEISPYVIGITGSYGKTSTKDALAQILQVSLDSTFWPKKGVNTEMGITREIREYLRKETRYAVMEMGAYGKGSIEKLCRLTPPRAGIITTIGVAHLDRFGDQNTIREAKSELAQAIPSDGILVCNGDNEGTRWIAQKYPKKHTLLYGFDNSKGDLDCWIKECHLSSSETIFVLRWKDQDYRGVTPLAGRAALSNLAGSFAMACTLGAVPELVIGVMSNLKPVDNRLQVYREGEITYLRDAYNSNPDGFSDALDVLATFDNKRKILMTPGLIEVSSIEKMLHQKIGQKAGKICDYAILVGETNRESLLSGLLSGGMTKEQITSVSERDQAFNKLKAMLQPGDVVLIENDLPDLYTDVVRF